MPLRTQLHSLSHLISCLSRMAANSRCICRSLSCFLHFNSTLVFSFLSPFFFSYSKENYVRENVNCNTNVCLFLLQKGKKWKSKKRGSWSCFFFIYEIQWEETPQERFCCIVSLALASLASYLGCKKTCQYISAHQSTFFSIQKLGTSCVHHRSASQPKPGLN